MLVETVPINSIFEDPKNARIHPPKNIEGIKASLVRFGQQRHLVVSIQDKTIIAGNGTFRAAKELGWKEIGVVWSKLSVEESKAYGIADNQLGLTSEWDINLLASNTKELSEWQSDQDWTALGFTNEEIQPLINGDWDSNPEWSDSEEKPKEKQEWGGSIKLTKEQREIFDRAVAKLREEENDPTISEGRVLELISATYLS